MKFEKVDDYMIKITTEEVQVVPLNALMVALKKLEMQKEMVEKEIKDISQTIEEAKKLGVKPLDTKKQRGV